VLVSVDFAGFFMMLGCMKMVAVGYVSMVSGFLVIAFFVVLGGFAVVLGSEFQMIGGFMVVFNAFWHDNLRLYV